MDIVVEIKSPDLHGPETSTNLPAVLGVEYHQNLQDAIRSGLLAKIKHKVTANGLAKDRVWKMANIGNSIPDKDAAKYIGNHKLKIKLNGTVLDKEVKLSVLNPKKPIQVEEVGKINSKAMNKARNELESLAKQAPKFVTMKKGDGNHPTALRYSIKLGDKDHSGTLYDGADSHVKEGSAKASLSQWAKDKAALAEFIKELKSKKEAAGT